MRKSNTPDACLFALWLHDASLSLSFFFFFFCTALRVLLRTLACGWNDQGASGCIHDSCKRRRVHLQRNNCEPSCRAGNRLLYASLSALPNGSSTRPATLSFARPKGRCEVDAGPAISKPYSSSGPDIPGLYGVHK